MWVFTLDGFFSAVEHRTNVDDLMVRCRSEQDAERLSMWLRLRMVDSPVQHTPQADYEWRLRVPKVWWARYLSASTERIRYDNFKDEVYKTLGPDHAHHYGMVWMVMLNQQRDEQERR
jgi:hypothetical protein